jgi:hypothetical protein
MNKKLLSIGYAALLCVATSDALAWKFPPVFHPRPPRTPVPEIDMAAGGSALALLGGMVVLLKERRKSRKPEQRKEDAE